MSVELNNVINSLEKVPNELKQDIFNMSRSMSDIELIRLFNQHALDLFSKMLTITKRMGRMTENKQIMGHKHLFDTAIKANTRLPIDKFTLLILEFAAEIYEGNADCFLNMPIPDTKVSLNNEFGMIRSEMFKELWKIATPPDHESIKDTITLLTTYAHAFFYQTILKYNK